jgi:glutamate-1-semialdehyde 2,1-aminomutase
MEISMNFGFDTTRSRELSERLQRSLPGGDTRSVTFFRPYPLAMERGEGYRVWDVDGNEFVDFLNNYTALVHGHAAPAIVEAIRGQASRGTAFPAPHTLQADLAERICARFRSIERVRFTNSGSEADMIAIRAARAFTGREEIVKADGGYHGLWEQVPMSWGEQHAQKPSDGGVMTDEGSAGETWDAAIPDVVKQLVHMVDYNNVDQLEATMAERGDRIAAVIMEPVLGEGVIAGSSEFFNACRRACDEHGALLIIDEVVTARLALGGYQQVLGVEPDLTVLGKIIGGGLPVGAVGGRAEVMEIFDPRRERFLAHAGTFNGNPLTTAAGCASLDLLSEEEIDRINRLGDQLAEALREALEPNGVDGRVTNVGSLVHVHPETAGGEIESFKDVDVHSERLSRLHLAALDEGLYFAPRGMLNVSTPMDGRVIADAAEAIGRAAARTAESFAEEQAAAR